MPIFAVVGDAFAQTVLADAPSSEPLTPEAIVDPSSLTLSQGAVSPGEVTTLTGQFDVFDDEITDGVATLVLGETAASGVVVVPVDVMSLGCWSGRSGTTCRYGFAVDLAMRPTATLLTSQSEVSNQLLVGVRVSEIDPLIETPLDFSGIAFAASPAMSWFPSGQTGDYTIRGRVAYRRNNLSSGADPNGDPHFGSGASSFINTPLVATRIEVRDGCGHIHQGLTHEDGGFELIFSTTCPQLVAQVHVLTESTRGFVRADVRDLQGDLHEFLIGAFTPGVHEIQWLPDALIPMLDAAKFEILQQGVLTQRWAKPRLGAVGNMPWAHYIYERNWCPDSEASTSEYSPDDDEIRICSADANGESTVNRDEFDPWTIRHETFHWLHHHFLVQGLDSSIYSGPTRDFTEGFATAMAGMAVGSPWSIERLGGGDSSTAYGRHAFTVESLDFNGHTTVIDLPIPTVERWLPVELWKENSDNWSSSGGWAWRILWDIADLEQPNVAEPWSDFSRGSGGPPANIPANFDLLGSPEMYFDVLTGYLHREPANIALPDLDSRGFPDLDTAEILDGVVCRSGHTWDAEISMLANTVMDYRQYDPQEAPLACP